MRRAVAMLRNAVIGVRDFFVALLVFALYALIRALPTRFAVDFGGAVARGLSHVVPRSKMALAQIAAAFPDRSDAEHRHILRDVWDNLGRTCVEYCHLDRIWHYDTAHPELSTIKVDGIETFDTLRDDEKPAIIVTAHLANWELPMVAAAQHGLNAAALYRAPNNKWVAAWVLKRRKLAMGRLIASRRGSIHAMSNALEQSEHLGILTDQHFMGGIESQLFGRRVLSNPAFARLARLHECPVHAVRVIRAQKGFKVELTPELNLPRGADGKIDVQGAVDMVNALFEQWITEHPGQWLWLHRRWRTL